MQHTGQKYGEQRVRLGAGAAVVALHGVLGLALLTAFSGGVVQQIIHNTLQVNDWTPVPPPPRPIEPVHKAQPHPDPIAPPLDPIPLPKGDGFTLGPMMPVPLPGGDDRGVLGDVPPQPRPHFAPVMARPIGNPGDWISDNDYPSRALREGWSGVTRLHLVIGSDGKVDSCSVTASSGHPELDAVACTKVSERARFSPAKDDTGAIREGTYDSAIHWQITELP